MPYDNGPHQHRPPHGPHGPQRAGSAGIPDGLLVGVLAFLVGVTLFAWTATGLAGLFAHGSWPEGVTFGRTPLAIRELATEPHDLKGAWPQTPAKELSGYGLFWGIFISQFMVLIVLTIFALGTITRARAVRRARRMAQETGASTATGRGTGSTGEGTAEEGAAGERSVGERSVGERPVEKRAPRDDLLADGGQATEQPVPGVPLSAAHPPPNRPSAERPAENRPTADHDFGDRPPTERLTATDRAPDAPAPTIPAPFPTGTSPHPGGSPSSPDPQDAVTRVLEAPGAALVASPSSTLWAATKAARSKLGPVHLFDPTHACDTPDRIRWSPHHACADRATAAARAGALLAPLRSPRPIDATTHTTAETLLRCWLHAAALDDRPFREVHRWSLATSPATDPVQTLRTHPKASAGSAGELEAVLTGHPQLRSDATALIRRALSPLSQLHVRNACTAARADRVALESFINETGTLYVVGEDPDVLPILNALTQSVVEHGRRMAARSSAGRLDPPLTSVVELKVP